MSGSSGRYGKGPAALLGICAACAAWGGAAVPVPPEGDRVLAREIFKELIEINTTHEHGSTGAATAIHRRLLAAGFAPGDMRVLAPADHPTKGSLVVRYRGKPGGHAVLFLGHLDVVDAKPEDWSVDPFKLTEKDGWFYGRGTIDMKNGDAALVDALIRLKRQGFTPERDLIVAFTADEEAGGDANGPAFLLKDHRDLIDAEFAINLDGGQGNYKQARPFYYEFGTSEKTYVTYTLETTSAGGHGSLPGPDNAIYRLADGLHGLEAYQFPVMLTATTRSSFQKMADLEQGPDSADMRAVAATPSDPAAAQRLSRNVRLNAQLRTTCVATLISGGHAENALPQRARATVQCRMMPGDSAARCRPRSRPPSTTRRSACAWMHRRLRARNRRRPARLRPRYPRWFIPCGRACPSFPRWRPDTATIVRCATREYQVTMSPAYGWMWMKIAPTAATNGSACVNSTKASNSRIDC